uniref:Uncharacterized protein n=1 Tax=Oryza punctata TaxID=4537 RepID=A0A0E0LJJ3_ORYPU
MVASLTIFVVEEERERSKREVAEWKKLVEQAETTRGYRRPDRVRRNCKSNSMAAAESDSAERAALSKKLVEKHTALCYLLAEVDLRAENAQIQYQHFQRELDAAKGVRDQIVKSLEPTLKVLFPSLYEGKHLVQLVAELVSEGPVAVRQLSKSVANLSASHALAVVKSHYPRVDLDVVEKGYAA